MQFSHWIAIEILSNIRARLGSSQFQVSAKVKQENTCKSLNQTLLHDVSIFIQGQLEFWLEGRILCMFDTCTVCSSCSAITSAYFHGSILKYHLAFTVRSVQGTLAEINNSQMMSLTASWWNKRLSFHQQLRPWATCVANLSSTAPHAVHGSTKRDCHREASMQLQLNGNTNFQQNVK